MFELGFYVSPAQPEALRRSIQVLLDHDVSMVGTNGFMEWRDDPFCREVGGVFRAMGVRCRSVHAPFGICFPGAERRGQSVDDIRRILDVAASWGASQLVWHFRWLRTDVGDTHFAEPSVMDALPPERIDDWMADALLGSCEYAERLGIGMNLENLPLFSWARDCGEILAFLRCLNRPNLGFIYDIGHAHANGDDPARAILEAGSLLRDTHFHDNFGPRDWDRTATARQTDIGKYDLHLSPGLGTINWCRVVQALRRVDFSAPVMFEAPNTAEFVAFTLTFWRLTEQLADHVPAL